MAKVFFVLSITFLALSACAMAWVFSGEEDKGASVIGAIEIAGVAVVFLVLWLKMRQGERNPELALKRGAAISAASKESMPDFAATNEFVVRPHDKRSPKAWISRESKQIQFLLLDSDPAHPRKKGRLRKTKCLDSSSLIDIELKVAREAVTHVGGCGVNPVRKTAWVAGGGTISTRVIGYYSGDFLFDDVDLPFVSLRFGRDAESAKKMLHAIKAFVAECKE